MTIPHKMKGAILVEQRKPLLVDEIELPSSLDYGQVLVKIHFSGICGSQLGEIDGAKGEDKYLPHLLGHEASGIVVAIGPGVRFVKPKDKVVLHWRKSLGIESSPPIYRWRGKQLNAGWVTTFNEYAIVSENRLTPIPEESDLKIATLFGCAVTTGFGVIVNNAKLKIGESVVVFGAGGVGLNIVQAAALVSAYPIIAVDIYPERLELAREMGATHLILNKQENALEEINKIIYPEKEIDCFIDNTGKTKVIEFGYKITKPQGRVILVGVPSKGNDISIFSLPLHFGKGLIGSHGGEAEPHQDIPRYYKLFSQGKIKLQNLLTDFFKLEEINSALEAMRTGQTRGRCVIEM